MKNGYDQFFRKARQNAAAGVRPPPPPKTGEAVRHTLSEKDLEAHIKRKLGVRTSKRKRRGISWKMIGVSFLGLLLAATGFVYHEKVEKILTMVEIDLLGIARAQEAPANGGKGPASVSPAATAPVEMIESKEELDHLSKLKDKKKELDAREEEINRVEAELQKQKEELENKLKALKETREQISRALEERVKGDEQKVETLVQMYSNMRPPQAAKIFETLDEDLAIEILSRMKKKNAADIMNLLKPEKAQVFSEKFAGYKRK